MSMSTHKRYTMEEYHLWQPFTQMQTFLDDVHFVVERGEGPYLFDTQGKQYLNLISCLWNAPLGLSRDDIVDAIADQLRTLGYSPIFRASHTPAIELAGLVAQVTPGDLNRVFFTSNGSEAIESGVKMVRQYYRLKGQDKYKVISLKLGYHGVSYAAMAASGLQADKELFKPVPDGFLQIPPPYCYRCEFGLEYPSCELKCAHHLEEVVLEQGPDSVAMFLMEPVMGVAGCVAPPPEYLKTIAEICKKYDIILMLDEITTGFGRTGNMFAAQTYDVEPSIMALGKGISAGYFPLGATVATDEIFREFLGPTNERRFNHGSTYAGHPGACAAGIKTIDYFTTSNVIAETADKGRRFFEQLKSLEELPVVGDVRGVGMMFGIEFVTDKESKTPMPEETMQRIMMACFAAGLFVHLSGNCIILMPPFVMTDDLLTEAAAKLRAVFQRAPRWMKK